jgi:Domain of unknown function (DUF4258)
MLDRIRELVVAGAVRVSEHGYDELSADGILSTEVLAGVENARVVEDSPHYGKGPCILVLQFDAQGEPVHVVWGIPKGHTEPAVLVTACRPDPQLWENDFVTRRP